MINLSLPPRIILTYHGFYIYFFKFGTTSEGMYVHSRYVFTLIPSSQCFQTIHPEDHQIYIGIFYANQQPALKTYPLPSTPIHHQEFFSIFLMGKQIWLKHLVPQETLILGSVLLLSETTEGNSSLHLISLFPFLKNLIQI